jgi:hypothetical protein
MDPATMAFPIMTPMRLLMRSMIVNLSLGVAAVAGFAGVYTVVNYVSPATKRRAMLRTLTESPVIPVAMMMAFLDSKDPLAMLRDALTHTNLEPELASVLRKALVMTL